MGDRQPDRQNPSRDAWGVSRIRDSRPTRTGGRRNLPARLRSAVLAALALAGVLGCSTLPTAPRYTVNAASSLRSTAAASPGGIYSPAYVGISPAEIVPAGKDTTYFHGDTLVVERAIKGADGGEVKSGLYVVDMPAGSFAGDAVVSVRVDQTNPMRCELHITPASANGFSKPVTLTVDCAGKPRLSRLGIVWLNEASGSWEEVDGCSVDMHTGLVSAPLQQFSTYAVTEVIREGKAGW